MVVEVLHWLWVKWENGNRSRELTLDFSSVECTLFSGNLLFIWNVELQYFC